MEKQNLFKIQPWKHQLEGIMRAKDCEDGFAFFFEVGCVSWDTSLRISRGKGSRYYTIEELYRKFNRVELSGSERGFDPSIDTYIRSMKEDYIGLVKVLGVVRSGIKEMYKLQLKRQSIKLTKDHMVFTKRGWVEAGDLNEKDFVAIDTLSKHDKKDIKKKVKKPKYMRQNVGPYHLYSRKTKSKPYIQKKSGKATSSTINIVDRHRAIYEANLNGLSLSDFVKNTYQENDLKFVDPSKFHIHHIDHNSLNNSLDNLQCLPKGEHLRIHGNYSYFGHGKINWSKFCSLEYIGEQVCYDIEVEKPYSNFVGNRVVVHNSGKTMTCINTIRFKFAQENRLMKTLILGPPIVLNNWKNEFLMHSNIKANDIVILNGTQKNRCKLLEKCKDQDKILITNYESLLMKDLFKMIEEYNIEVLVLDESHKVKSIQSKRTKAAIKLADQARYKFLLSGTPILNSMMDVFSQFRVLDSGETFGKNFVSFRGKYFYDKNSGMPKDKYFPNWIPRPGIEEEINRLISNKSMHVTKNQCLDLPPLVKTIIPVEMSREQQKAYNDMNDDLIAYINDTAAVAELAITKALRMQQIVSGFVNDHEGEIVRFKNPRKDALKELLEEITPSSKVLVWAVFKENYNDIREVCEKLKIKYVEVHGGIKQKDKMDNVDSFCNDNSIRVFIGHPGSGGIGITLIEASYMIFYSRNFSLEYDIQAEARCYRGGSEIHKKVTRFDLVSKGTIDEDVVKALQEKKAIGFKVLSDWIKK